MRTNQRLASLLLASLAGFIAAGAAAQDRGTLDPKPLPPLANPTDPSVPAKELFGRKPKPASSLAARSIGFYSRGCLAGGQALPVDGRTWQVMRLSRNRNWGNPVLISFLERFSAKVPEVNGWPGLLVGDMAQPRGGPMITGHASHQIGLDADVWFSPMPRHKLSRSDREEMAATNLVREDRLDIDREAYTLAHMKLIRAVAREPEVERVFVNPAIKKAFCRDAGRDRSWLSKVRPIWGHNYHFHIRLSCPAGEAGCQGQTPPGPDDGCGGELDKWFTDEMLFPRPGAPARPVLMSALPAECRKVLVAP